MSESRPLNNHDGFKSPTPRLLLIDNDEGMLAALRVRLESAGYECVTAANGEQGLAAFRDGGISLVITDLNMPSGDGVQLAETIRDHSHVPIIIITGFRREYNRDLRHLTGVTIVEKPFSADGLIEIIEADLVLAACQNPRA